MWLSLRKNNSIIIQYNWQWMLMERTVMSLLDNICSVPNTALKSPFAFGAAMAVYRTWLILLAPCHPPFPSPSPCAKKKKTLTDPCQIYNVTASSTELPQKCCAIKRHFKARQLLVVIMAALHCYASKQFLPTNFVGERRI